MRGMHQGRCWVRNGGAKEVGKGENVQHEGMGKPRHAVAALFLMCFIAIGPVPAAWAGVLIQANASV